MRFCSKKIALSLVVAFMLLSGGASQARTEETSHLAFVNEYIRELVTNEDLRANAERELKAITSASGNLSSSIHAFELMKLELQAQIRMLKSMHLNPPSDELIPGIISAYEQKIALYQNMIDISSALIGGPRQGGNYGKLVAEVPKIRAALDYVDKTLFMTTPLIFATLIDMKPDSKNHVSHLIITKEERERLLHDINAAFGNKLDQKNQKYAVSSASLLKSYLSKNFKCSDEPWE
jgi:hypothetical protein